MSYRLSLNADEDLRYIYIYGVKEFGLELSESYVAGLERTFELLAEHPRAARERTELKPSVRAYRYKSHMIVYEITDSDDVVIPRLRQKNEDWASAPV